MTKKEIFQKFSEECENAGFEHEQYNGRYSYEGPAVRTDEENGPSLQDVIRATSMKLQWDTMGKTDFIVYPVV